MSEQITEQMNMLEKFETQEKKATRDGFGEGLLELGRQNKSVVALCADLTGSLKMNAFKDEFPDRFFQCGVAEANMMSVAAGLAIGGKIPFTGTFANFSTGRVYDQIRQSIAYSHKNVKICASHAGLTLGEDGATHQILEDIGMMQMLPGMTVINPCDAVQTKAATIALADHEGPAYLRFGRPSWPIFMNDMPFEIGKIITLKEGTDVTIVATGHMVWQSIEAARALEKSGISVELLNAHTIKPLDDEVILRSVAKTRAIVVAEEHQKIGGLGSTVASLIGENQPTPIKLVGVNNSFGESGTPQELLVKYGLGVDDVVVAVRGVVNLKS